MQDNFKRKEQKYIINTEQYKNLVQKLESNIIKDDFYKYKICNIYYDDDNYTLLKTSADKPTFKEKLRLRSYGIPNNKSDVFIEIKKKYNGIVYKRRIIMQLNNAYNFIKAYTGTNYDITIKEKDINKSEIIYMLQRYNLKPKIYLSYDREAYTWKTDEDLRITFDTNLKFRTENVGLENGDEGQHIFNHEQILMEIKCINNVQYKLAQILNELKIYPVSYSKIGEVFKKYIRKG